MFADKQYAKQLNCGVPYNLASFSLLIWTLCSVSSLAQPEDRFVPIGQSRQRSRARNFALSARKVFTFYSVVKEREREKKNEKS